MMLVLYGVGEGERLLWMMVVMVVVMVVAVEGLQKNTLIKKERNERGKKKHHTGFSRL